ncbi:MAG: hypothetical protein RIF41_08075 [Polyangiaceae bacterium]
MPSGNASSRKRTTPWIAYRGPSAVDGKLIRAALYTLYSPRNQANRKTGPMAQLMIAPDEVPPHEAVNTGMDRSVCGDCRHRPALGGGCYVNVGAYFPRVWETSSDQPQDLEGACAALRESRRPLRLGSWGDPAALPFEVVSELIDAADGHTAYTSLWRTCDPRFSEVAMASVASQAEREEARSAGWKTFRIRPPSGEVVAGEMICPASEERGHVATCADCLACAGTSGGDGRRDVVIIAHGVESRRRRVLRVVDG